MNKNIKYFVYFVSAVIMLFSAGMIATGFTVRTNSYGSLEMQDTATQSVSKDAYGVDGMLGGVSGEIAPDERIMPPIDDSVTVPYGDKIIKNGSVVIDSKNISSDVENIKKSVAKADGVVVSENMSGGDFSSAYLMVLIPSEKFESVVSTLKSGFDIYSFNANTSDETKIYQDTTSRLKIAEEQLEAVQQLLNKTNNINEILEIRDRSTALQQEIEFLKSSLQNIDNRVQYSSLNITVQSPQAARGEYGWWENTVSLVISALQGSIRLLIVGFVALAPFVVTLGIVVIIVKTFRKKKSKNQV